VLFRCHAHPGFFLAPLCAVLFLQCGLPAGFAQRLNRPGLFGTGSSYRLAPLLAPPAAFAVQPVVVLVAVTA
jgi:hypothetical protein